ncbi:MAG: glycosyltransferase [Alphaproteobacteria bacterium]|nr:glycosyltransferase [Alphaproteobacteria bacterium]
MNIAFLISSLSSGGAERVASLLCNAWQEAGHRVDLLTFQAEDAPVHYKLAPGVTHHPLGLMKASRSLPAFVCNGLRRVLAVRRVLQRLRPDALVSFVTDTNVIAILAAGSLGIPVVISERIHPAAHPVGGLRHWLRKRTYPRASRIVVQTADIAAWVQRHIKAEAAVIPNPVRLDDFQRQPEKTARSDSRRRLIAVGRLTPQKGYDLLLEAFARLAETHADWDLTIFGEGDQRQELERAVRAHGLAARVSLPGISDDLHAELAVADLYVHPSRYEGYPNALVEALASGLCCVATDCTGANREILQDGGFGLLVRPEDADDLAATLDRAMSDPELRRRFSERAPTAVQPCALDDIAARWLQLLEGMTAHPAEVKRGERFTFGANWARFLSELDERRVRLAEASLKDMLEVETLQGKTFLDAGSGSGLFSLAARRLGARVHSFDYDPRSVDCTRELKHRFFPDDPDWTVEEASVLDKDYLERLGSFDVVYAWGVLHHTGAMWEALENVAPRVGKKGRLFLAIYNDQGWASNGWRIVKKTYNALPVALRWLILLPAFLRLWGPTSLRDLQRGRPGYTWRNYAETSLRGMSPWRDVVDWVGGYPFEVAKPEEILDFYQSRGFVAHRIKTAGNGIGCNEFVFEKHA